MEEKILFKEKTHKWLPFVPIVTFLAATYIFITSGGLYPLWAWGVLYVLRPFIIHVALPTVFWTIITLILKRQQCKFTATETNIYGKKGYKKFDISYADITELKEIGKKISIKTEKETIVLSSSKHSHDIFNLIEAHVSPDVIVHEPAYADNVCLFANETVLIKGVFGGKFLPIIFYVLAALTFVVFTAIDIYDYWDGIMIAIGLIPTLAFLVYGLILSNILKKRELIVTNKRVIARGAFGYRNDLPIEKVTNVSTSWLGGIGCASPSSKIKFHFCENNEPVLNSIIAESLKRDNHYQ